MVEDDEAPRLGSFEEHPAYQWEDRGRGILTDQDREYLAGERELTGQDERNARYRIRQRLIRALDDIAFLNWHLANEDLAQVAEENHLHPDYLISMACQLLAKRNPLEMEETLEKELQISIPSALAGQDHTDQGSVYYYETDVDITTTRKEIDLDELEENLPQIDTEDLEQLALTVDSHRNTIGGNFDRLLEMIMENTEHWEVSDQSE